MLSNKISIDLSPRLASIIPNPSLRLHAKPEEIIRRIFHRRNSAQEQEQEQISEHELEHRK